MKEDNNVSGIEDNTNQKKDQDKLITGIEGHSHEEIEDIFFSFDNPERDLPMNKTIHQIFEEQVEKTPDGIACISGNEKLTFRELSEISNQIANYLQQKHNIKTGCTVGIKIDKSVYFIVAVLGILKSGGAYLPISNKYPAERIKSIIDDAMIGVIITDNKNIELLNRLQYECKSFHTYLSLDSISSDSIGETDKLKLSIQTKLWNHVGNKSGDEISTSGWVNSYTGKEFSAQEMDEYVDNTVRKIKPYVNNTSRVLEIGCGSGLVMNVIAKNVALYFGTDLSKVIIEKTGKIVSEGKLNNVKLSALAAHEIDKIEERGFDIIMLNSVVQHFPSYNYFRNVISKAIELAKEESIIFVGDIRDLHLRDSFISSLNEYKKNNTIDDSRESKDFQAELFFPREYFEDFKADFKEIAKIYCTDKYYTINNELTQYRFDALFAIKKKQNDYLPEMIKHKNQDDIIVLKSYSTEPLISVSNLSDPACVVYTLDAAGNPNSAMVEHLELVNRLNWNQKKYPIEEKDFTLLV